VRERASALLPIAALLLLAGITFWLDNVVRSAAPDRPARHEPDYFAERFQIQRFNAEGKLQHTLSAERMVHYPDDDSTEATAPRLIYHRLPVTEVSAKRAWVGRDGKEIILRDDVRVSRQAAPGDASRAPTVMSTAWLQVLPDDEKGHTDAPVTITKGSSVLRGSGLDIDNRSRVSVLRGRVNGTFHRNQGNKP